MPIDGSAQWARVGEQMAKAWEKIEKRARNIIQDGERDEVNPCNAPERFTLQHYNFMLQCR
jgi:hypothetical protein